ncbi:hypothetical protein A3Q56_00567 [Intoshia linei]|uniref:Uncharacterized protein n=1 Tax=Intoshia linei TaxID=1819745 RepID=A0A177BBV4_9BILA|nr:hypothetical protein A3Q56_00567 [Intoshia linei]
MQDKDGNIIIQKKNISELFGKTGMIYYFQPKKTEQLFTTNDYLNIVKATDTEFYMIENPIPENDSISESSVLSHMLRKTTIKHISFENILDISETSEKQSGDGFAFKLKETQKQKYEEIKPHILQNKNDSARKIREKFSFLETQQNEQLSEIKYDLTSSQDLINLMDNFENFEDD